MTTIFIVFKEGFCIFRSSRLSFSWLSCCA